MSLHARINGPLSNRAGIGFSLPGDLEHSKEAIGLWRGQNIGWRIMRVWGTEKG